MIRIEPTAAAQGVRTDNPRTDRFGDAKGFGDYLKEALRQVNDAAADADRAAQGLVLGEVQDVHQVMLATERANLLLQLTIRVRNKLIEGYQEISRMQI